MKKDILTHLFNEAGSYQTIQDIERLVEDSGRLSMIPIQPLYLAIRSANQDYLPTLLPKFSAEQRQALLDLDLWNKDEIELNATEMWIRAYSQVSDEEIRAEFAQSEIFLLALKSQCVISTFDEEDPNYPEGDSFFITDDNLLLIEYPPEFTMVHELKSLIKDLYQTLGVEAAYAHLLKMTTDSYLLMEEEEYQRKKERLRDYGMLDFYEALSETQPILPLKQIENAIRQSSGKSGEIVDELKNQGLHAQSMAAYHDGLNELRQGLENIHDEFRLEFLRFNFIRLVNARIMAENSLKGGSLALSQTGYRTKQALELGHSYAAEMLGSSEVLKKLDFNLLYRVGAGLIENQRRTIKQVLNQHGFDKTDQEYFLGSWWQAFIENSFHTPAKLKIDGSSSPLEISNISMYRNWEQNILLLQTLLPFIEKFHSSLAKMRADNIVSNHYYSNYQVENIDFEALMLSSLINFFLGHFENTSEAKLGITIEELKKFYKVFFFKREEEWLLKGDETKELNELLYNFSERFGFAHISGFSLWLRQIMVEQMNGYEIENMSLEDFRHVGGPIILNSAKH